MKKTENISWPQYNEQTKNNPLRPLLLKSLELFKEYKGNAIDIGCGAGNDSVFLCDNGWNVLAVDKNADGLNNLQEKCPQIQTINNSFENLIELPKADLVITFFSVPFCTPQYFNKFIKILRSAKWNAEKSNN